MSLRGFFVVLSMVTVAFLYWGGGAGCGSTSTTPTDTGTTSSSAVTLTGQVAVESSDLALTLQSSQQAAQLLPKGRVGFKTAADAVASSFDVTLVKVLADGTEEAVSGVTATTDSSGAYTLENVPVVTAGTGAETDFYYEVRASNGTVEVRAPAAPAADSTVNISPETKLAAKMLTEVSEDIGPEASVLPSGTIINRVRDLVADDVSNLGESSFALPSMATANDANVNIAANAVSAGNTNSEKIIRAYLFQKEELDIDTNATTATEAAPYLERVMKASCNFNQNLRLPQQATLALADALVDGTTFTPAEIATALGSNGAGGRTVDNGLTDFGGLLDNLDTRFEEKGEITDDDVLGLYVGRDLGSSSLASDTELEVDQALAFAQGMLADNNRCGSGIDMVGFIGDLTGNPVLNVPAFSDVDLYPNRMQCAEGQLSGQVMVYIPPAQRGTVTVAAVTVNNGTQTVNLTEEQAGSGVWRVGNAQMCLAFGTNYTLTVAADLNGADDITTTVTRTPLNIPEARISVVGGEPLQNNENNPAAVSEPRPMFTWTPAPGTESATDIGAPEGSKIKYLFDISHFSRQTGGPDNRCDVFQNNTRFYENDYFLASIDCDAAACDTLTGAASGDHICRLHVQTVLVDVYDRTLGWSAGGNIFYCIEGQTGCN